MKGVVGGKWWVKRWNQQNESSETQAVAESQADEKEVEVMKWLERVVFLQP